MSDKKMEKIYLAVQDIRTLAARTRPGCTDARDCPGCPAEIAMPDRSGAGCLFDICRRKGETMKESMSRIFCCICRRPMVPILSGPGEEKLWRCTTPGCTIHEYARMKNHHPLR